ncbi:MAG: hypothetical protein KKE64_01560 [Candidatus Omnitrophica bacterium]|nr:hypothetical protein [Candidatus Omnitrophota bacterium]
MKNNFVRNIIISGLVSLLFVIFLYLNSLSIKVILIAWSVSFFIFVSILYYFRASVVFLAGLVGVIIYIILELSLLLLSRGQAINLNSSKVWFHFNAQPKKVLVCYPTNPQGYFNVDLREPSVREKYGLDSSQCVKNPYCIEEVYNRAGYIVSEILL